MKSVKKDDPAVQKIKKYVTLAKEAHVEMEERKSIFLGHAKPVKTEEEAMAFLNGIRREYHDATHNVWAYQLAGGSIARYSDDGEPQGTAGVPVLNVIKMSGADDMIVVVTRYFGGILLGAGGLVRAYSASAKQVVDEAGIVTFEEHICFRFACSYAEYQRIRNEFSVFGMIVDETLFAEEVTVIGAVKTPDFERLQTRITELTNGKSALEQTATRMN